MYQHDMLVASPTTSPAPRLRSSPVLLHRLPSATTLEQESSIQSELELQRQVQQVETERRLAEALQDEIRQSERAAVSAAMGSWTAHRVKEKEQAASAHSQPFMRPPQAYELYRAIDRKDIDFIMRVRDHSFKLLTQKNGTDFPIVYAARLGTGWRDVVVLLVGALSRSSLFVYAGSPGAGTNLKLAIDHSLHSTSPQLLSSYLQVLIMSEGDSFLHKATYDLSLQLRDPAGRPVFAAKEMVRRFCTRELRGVKGGVGEVEDYVANAALDLVIMAVWSLAAGQVNLDPLPTHTFARDLQTWRAFQEACSDRENSVKLGKTAPRVRRMLQLLQELGGDSKKGVRGRLRDVEEVFDEGKV
ncbi:uncharacterized protein L203_104799 [Cryptococcus depauperatus CBS 7841]|uniref:Uncharacterized protein n=1 Tax=Cryptococcus depauperatus CBS 7841 TaxID=1295531 RepID=A0AAJ8JW51_9TREE